MNTRWGEGVWAALVALADRLATIGPAVFVMITLIVLGLLAGALLRAVVSRLARAIGFDRHMERWGIGSSVRGAGVLRAPSDVLGLLFFWATFVIFASLGIDSLGFVNAGLPEARVLARAVHWGVLLFAGATALTHLGIGKEMVLVAFGITFGGLVFALALAFGLGGRRLARELLERRLRRDSPPARERLTHL